MRRNGWAGGAGRAAASGGAERRRLARYSGGVWRGRCFLQWLPCPLTCLLKCISRRPGPPERRSRTACAAAGPGCRFKYSPQIRATARARGSGRRRC